MAKRIAPKRASAKKAVKKAAPKKAAPKKAAVKKAAPVKKKSAPKKAATAKAAAVKKPTQAQKDARKKPPTVRNEASVKAGAKVVRELGRIIRIPNKDRKWGGSPRAWHSILAKGANGKVETLLLTIDELNEIRGRAERNPEDIQVLAPVSAVPEPSPLDVEFRSIPETHEEAQQTTITNSASEEDYNNSQNTQSLLPIRTGENTGTEPINRDADSGLTAKDVDESITNAQEDEDNSAENNEGRV